MKVTQYRYNDGHWLPELPASSNADFVLSFDERLFCEKSNPDDLVRNAFPNALHIGCTGSGDIYESDVFDSELMCTAISFNNSQVKAVSDNLNAASGHDIRILGRNLALRLPKENLCYVLVICDGHSINASALIEGLRTVLPRDLSLSGGLAGDDRRFQKTLTWHNQSIGENKVILCGFYGKDLLIATGCNGGWQPFGPIREISRSQGNELLEIDQQPALDLYKRYLGRYSNQLPSSSLRFPLNVKPIGEKLPVPRTLIDINPERKSLLFAGEMPEGAKVQLMTCTHESMIDGASNAAQQAIDALGEKPDFALHISCVGRRLVLGQRVFEELETMTDIIGKDCPHAGFYSYGEIAATGDLHNVRLQNQVMTVTLFKERLKERG